MLDAFMSILRSFSFLVVVALQVIGHPIATAASPSTATVGGISIILPPPEGFNEPARKFHDLWALMETLTAPGNRLLAVFVSDRDLAREVSGKPAMMNRYFMVQTLRKLESTNISTNEFAKLKNMFKEQQQDLLERHRAVTQRNFDSASKELGRKLQDPTLSLKIGESVPLGIFSEDSSSISSAFITKYSVVTDGKADDVLTAGGMTIVLIKGRIVYLFAYSTYKSSGDAEWVRDATRRWLTAIATIN